MDSLDHDARARQAARTRSARAAWRGRLAYTLSKTRETSRMTRDEVARVLGVTSETIGRWETGQSDIFAFDLARLAHLYRMPSEWALDPPDWASNIHTGVGVMTANPVRRPG